MGGKVYIRAFGCQMNLKDTERMLGFLRGAGYVPVDDPAEADVLLCNTCSVRRKPEDKVLGLIGRWREYKEARPGVVIGLGGCVAQQWGERLLERLPALDLVFGTQAIHRLPELVARARAGERVAAVEWLPPGAAELFAIPAAYESYPVSAFVSIMQGCDNRCAFCIVPSVRGPARSRAAAEVLAEARLLAERGVRELTLLGQNVNAFRDRETDFPALLAAVAAAPGIERVRFTTSHPQDLDDRLIAAMAREPRVMEAIHLPVQAGADRTLRAMNRGYTRGHYLGLVARLRAALPGIGITTDLIVGFPGETEADFQETLALLREVRYDETFSFRYSIRPGTAAAGLGGQVAEAEKYDRLYRLQELQRAITAAKNEEQVGRVHEVLVEGVSKTDSGRLTGRGRTNRLVHFAGSAEPGEIIKVRIVQALKHSLVGEPLETPSASLSCREEETCLSR
jgi:tRNA-2-methylthio-N6-dimethylallyladenosine synthase